MEDIAILRTYDMAEKKQLAKWLSGIEQVPFDIG